MAEVDSLAVANGKLNEYLQLHHLRRTPERFAILETVYSFDGHFGIAALKERMDSERHFVVSLATIYNTFAILVETGVLLRHQLGGKTEYEKVAFGGESHIHLVCTGCGKVREYRHENLYRYLRDLKVYRFTPENYVLYLYGLCPKCSNAVKRNKEKLLKTKKEI